jgi:CheY-like chemotaxis protein
MSRQLAASNRPVVLVVDDEALLRMLATDYFEDAGFEVVEAANGREAIDVLEARPDIDAVFTDVQMPGTPDGIGLAKHVREVCCHCAIVVVSGRVHCRDVDLAPGAKFVPKPYDGSAVVSLVRELIAA